MDVKLLEVQERLTREFGKHTQMKRTVGWQDLSEEAAVVEAVREAV